MVRKSCSVGSLQISARTISLLIVRLCSSRSSRPNQGQRSNSLIAPLTCESADYVPPRPQGELPLPTNRTEPRTQPRHLATHLKHNNRRTQMPLRQTLPVGNGVVEFLEHRKDGEKSFIKTRPMNIAHHGFPSQRVGRCPNHRRTV
jgi:hypothetical protein